MRHSTHVRIATVKATQKRYMVLTLRHCMVHVYGDVYHAKGLTTRHQAAIKFQRDEVDIEEVRYTRSLLKQLLRQHLRGLRDKGYEVTMGLTKKGEVTYTATKALPSGSVSTLTIK